MINKQDVVLLKRKGSYRTSEMQKQVNLGHPFIVLSTKGNMINVSVISSQVTQDVLNGKYPQDYVIKDITSCGLSKSSYVSCDCRGIISQSNVVTKLGTMDVNDFNEVMKRVKKFPRRKVLECYKIYNTGEPEYLDYFYNENGTIEYLV